MNRALATATLLATTACDWGTSRVDVMREQVYDPNSDNQAAQDDPNTQPAANGNLTTPRTDGLWAFDGWDTSRDKRLDENEFSQGFRTGLWDSFDKDGDPRVNGDEFFGGLFAWWDGDDDGILDGDEWNDAGGWLDGVGLGDRRAMEGWDTTADQRVTPDEWRAGWGDNNLFEAWDANDDGFLTQEEIEGGLFAKWDDNGDGVLTRDEWHGR